MKKFVALFLVSFAFCSVASAESIVVIDQNGTVIRQMITSPTTYVEQPVIATVPTQTVTVVRESPVIENSYYYDSSSTNAAIAAGVTTAVVGGLLFHGFHVGHHHSHHHGGGKPIHHSGGKPGHHGGGKPSHRGGHHK